MVDVETGRAIYKRRLLGAVASEPAAVDTDRDGYLDRVYVGTTAGLMYRVDLTADSSGDYPDLQPETVVATDGSLVQVDRGTGNLLGSSHRLRHDRSEVDH